MTRRASTGGAASAALAAGALVAASLAATAAPVTAQDASTAPAGEPVTLRVNAENASIDSLTALANAYMELHPEVTIRARLQGLRHVHGRRSSTWPTCPTRPTSSSGNQGYVTDGTLVGAGLVDGPRPLLRAVRLERLVRRGHQGPVPLHRGRQDVRRGPALGHRGVSRLRRRLLQQGEARRARPRAADDVRGVRGRARGSGRGRRDRRSSSGTSRAGRRPCARHRPGRVRACPGDARLGLRCRRRDLRVAGEPPGRRELQDVGRQRLDRWSRRQRPRLRPGLAGVRRGRRGVPAGREAGRQRASTSGWATTSASSRRLRANRARSSRSRPSRSRSTSRASPPTRMPPRPSSTSS